MKRLASLCIVALLLSLGQSVRADDCVGDCDGTDDVTVYELIVGVNILLGTGSLSSCPSVDANGDGAVTVDELVTAVGNALDGCGPHYNFDACNAAPPTGPDVFGPATWDTTNATVDASDPQINCGCGQNSHSVWFDLTPLGSGVAHISTLGSTYNTVLAVFTGACGALTPLACNDDTGSPQSQLDLPVTAGTTYSIEVASRCDSSAGQLRFGVDICGDGVVSAREECDDGNLTNGDGCDAQCRFEQIGRIDQSWSGPTGLCSTSTGSLQILYAEPIGQEFTPTQSQLAAVDVALSTANSPSYDTLTTNIRKGTITGSIVASVSATPTASGAFWQHFALPAPVAIVPGDKYVIELVATNQTFSWVSRSGDGDACSVRTYPGGQRIDFGQPEPGDSFLFRTYAAVPAPTPTLSPTSTIITPTLTPTPTHLAPIVDCPGFEAEREILSRTVADLWGPSGASQSCSHITCPSGEVKISGNSDCLSNGIAAGFGYSNPFGYSTGASCRST